MDVDGCQCGISILRFREELGRSVLSTFFTFKKGVDENFCSNKKNSTCEKIFANWRSSRVEFRKEGGYLKRRKVPREALRMTRSGIVYSNFSRCSLVALLCWQGKNTLFFFVRRYALLRLTVFFLPIPWPSSSSFAPVNLRQYVNSHIYWKKLVLYLPSSCCPIFFFRFTVSLKLRKNYRHT